VDPKLDSNKRKEVEKFEIANLRKPSPKRWATTSGDEWAKKAAMVEQRRLDFERRQRQAAADKAAADKRKADETACQQRVAADQAAKVGGAAGALNKAAVNPKPDAAAKQTNEAQTKPKRQM
jgi:hypothetical protein